MASGPEPWLLRVREEKGRERWGGLALGIDTAQQKDWTHPAHTHPLLGPRSSSASEESPIELGSQLGALGAAGCRSSLLWSSASLTLGLFIPKAGSHNIDVFVCLFLIICLTRQVGLK